MRWIWPSELKSPQFLSFYSAFSWKTIVFARLCQLIFFFRLQRLFFKRVTTKVGEMKPDLRLRGSDFWALFTGTPGPNRKAVLVANDETGQCVFLKMSIGVQAQKLLHREYAALKMCEGLKLKNSKLPLPMGITHRYLKLSALNKGKRSSILSEHHVQFLYELKEKTLTTRVLKESTFWTQCLYQFKNLETVGNQSLPKAMKRKLQWLIAATEEYKGVELSYAHGDFTPWNTYVYDQSIGVYDWELAQNALPLGYDAFHFVIQQGILVERKPWLEILTNIDSTVVNQFFDGDKVHAYRYLKLYLLSNVLYYLNIYANQKQWHTQVPWLMNTWNEALSWLLRETAPHRKLLIMDLFDYVQNKSYTTLKFKGVVPELISPYSDIDLCIDKTDALGLNAFLKQHPLVKKSQTSARSHMLNTFYILENGESLSLDCIWKIKRKNLVFQNAFELINTAQMNAFGVKQPSLDLETTYVNRFYALNGEKTPLSYRSESFELELKMNQLKKPEKPIKNILKSKLLRQKENRGVQWLANTLWYVIDTVRTIFQTKGTVITFSGVDGAGKSTLIEHTKTYIQKSLRKQVVVLRHRPSLLPILSAWTMGKAAAEQKAVNTFPRAGSNNNVLSSLLRFAYYYLDYIIGQFYVYFRYVLPGKIVIYDRYYFDFISDSKRSNILIPKWLSRLGYLFIYKPKLNILLYADVATIRSRKKELDERTIAQLTQNYKGLFTNLQRWSTSSKYLSFNNVDAQTTMEQITNEIKLQAV